ncbi:MAG TPA: hypothetical protein VGL53_06520 [Bryobacteraceae bacterium]|jgi:hypothetical protein
MERKSAVHILLGFAILAAAGHAQGIPITLSCSGAAVSPTASTGTCTTKPFGPLMVAIDLDGTTISANFTFTFPNGASFTASDAVMVATQLQGSTLTGTATIHAGAGTISLGSLMGSSGSLTYVLNVTRPSFTLTGSGLLVVPNFTSAGFPISGPGGSVLPALCNSGASSQSGCIPVEAGAGSFQIFEGSSAPSDGVLVLANPGNSASGRLTFEGAAGSGASVLTFASSSSGGPQTDSIVANNETTPAGLNILTPVQASNATYSAAVACDAPTNTPCWISIPSGSTGSIAANSRAAIPITVNPESLTTPGTYRSSVLVSITPDTGAPATLIVPVNVEISPAGPIPTLSQTGLQFSAESGSTAATTQLVLVSNSGSGTMLTSAAAFTLAGGNWLTVSPSSLTVTPTTPAQLYIQANPTGLAPGVYCGRVDVTAGGVTQSIVAVLTVSQAAGPSVSPASLTFVAPANGNPESQTVLFSNPSSQPLTVSLGSFFEQSAGWFGASVSAPTATTAAPLAATVQVDVTGLAPGVYSGTLGIRVAETNREYPVSVVLVVPQQGGSSGTSQAAACTPTRLLPLFTNLEPGFTAPAGIPAPLQVSVTDDCGTPLTVGGSVMVSFPGSSASASGGDTPIALAPLGNGLWSGTWMPHNLKGGPTTVSVIATSSATPSLYGSAGVSGTLTANGTIPLIASGGAVWNPGTRAIVISGSNLATASATATLPLPTTLGGTRVLLGGQPLPLQSVSPGRISAVLPDNSTPLAVVVVERNGTSYSMPEPITPLAPSKRRPPPREKEF